jgi:putative sugar O-methyltransferase
MQINDDPGLLEKMICDMNNCEELYKPTNYWAYYQRTFLPELKKYGLRNFRCRQGSILTSFGATDNAIKVILQPTSKIRGLRRIANFFNRFIGYLPFFEFSISEIDPKMVCPYFYWYVKDKFRRVGLDLDKSPTSEYGNPEDLIEINGGFWTTAHLQNCSIFVDAIQHIKLSDNSVICELGPGMGRNIEIMAHLYETATFLLFDIPPQLYISYQYLQAVFPSRVINYRQATAIADPQKDIEKYAGKIILLPSWKFPEWSKIKVDLFWNSASFQEMEPNVVKNYLSLVLRMSPHWIYINALPEGNYWGEWKPGRGGTKEPVDEKCYIDCLDKFYSLYCTYYTDYFLRNKNYKSYLFEKK